MTQQANKTASSDLRDHLIYRMSLLTTIADRNGKAVFQARFGLSLREYRILGVIAYAQPVSLMDLAEECYLDKGQVSRVVTKLEEGGLIERACENKTRGGAISLTEAGRPLIEEALAMGDALNAHVLSVLTAEEQAVFSQALSKVLGKVRAHFDEIHGGNEAR